MAEDVKISIGLEGEEEVKKGLEGIGKKSEEAGKTSSNAFKGMNTEIQKAVLSINLKAKALQFAMNSAMKMAKEFAQFEKALMKANTHLGLGREELIKYGRELEDIGAKTATSSIEMAEAFEKALSAGVDLTDSMDFMDVAAKFAQASFTDVTSSVDILTTAINAYGMETSDANKIADIFVKTQQLGKVSTDELSSSFSTIAGVSADFGISIEDVAGGLASMTAMGSSVSESLVQQRQMFAELAKQSTVAGKKFTEIAEKTFPEFIAEGNSVADAMELLTEHNIKTGESIYEMFGSVQAGSAALSLTGRNLDRFKNNIDEVGNSAGTMETAYETATDNMLDNFTRLGQVLKSDFTPIIANIINVINRLLKLYLNWRDRTDEVNKSNKVGMQLIKAGIDLHKLQNDVKEKGTELGWQEAEITLKTVELREQLADQIAAGADAQEAYNKLLEEMFTIQETGTAEGTETGLGTGTDTGMDTGTDTGTDIKEKELTAIELHNLEKLRLEKEFYENLIELRTQENFNEQEAIQQFRTEQIERDVEFYEKQEDMQAEVYNSRIALYQDYIKNNEVLQKKEEDLMEKHLEERKKIDEYSVSVSNATYSKLVEGRIKNLNDFMNVLATELTGQLAAKAVQHTAEGISDLALAASYKARPMLYGNLVPYALNSAKDNFAAAAKFGAGAAATGALAGASGGLGATEGTTTTEPESPIGGDETITEDIIDERTGNRTVIVQGAGWILEMINKESIDKYNKAIIE